MTDHIPDAFVIAEVLTSSDYGAAAEALANEADRYEESLDDPFSVFTEEEAEDLRGTIAEYRRRAERFERVAQQVREQELKVVGIT